MLWRGYLCHNIACVLIELTTAIKLNAGPSAELNPVFAAVRNLAVQTCPPLG